MATKQVSLQDHLLYDQRGLKFKERVRYNLAIQKVKNTTEGILLDWQKKSPISKVLEQQGWRKSQDIIHVSQIQNYWHINDIKNAVSLTFFVSSSGNEEPIDMIIRHCVFSSMVEVPYEKGPDIGQWSISSLSHTSLFWTYYNIVVSMYQYENNINLYEIGLKIQRILEEHVVKNISDYAPKIQELKVFQQEIYVNTPFEITVIPQTFSQYNKIENNAHTMDDIKYVGSKEEHQTKTYTFKALKPGDYTFVFTLGDLNTLLSSKKSIKVTILPSVDSSVIQESSK